MVTSTSTVFKTNDVVEAFLRTMIEKSKSPSQVAVGIHNTFVHGDILTEVGINIDDSDLSMLFNHLEAIKNILIKVEKDNAIR